MRQIELWKWIALSLGLEPSLIEIDHAGIDLFGDSGPNFGGLPRELAQEFGERFAVAISWVGDDSSLRPADPAFGLSVDHKWLVSITRPVFVNWTREVGWSIPSELEVPTAKPAAAPVGRRLNGWTEICEALATVVGSPVSERDARRRLEAAGVQINHEGNRVWITADDLAKVKAE